MDFHLRPQTSNLRPAIGYTLHLEPVTHFLFGANLGRAGLNRKTALATAVLTLAAEAPDLDVFSRFGGSAFALNHHRGFTHSFLGIPIVAAAVVAFMYAIWRMRGRKTRDPKLPPRWGLLFAYACLAGLSHILLDYTNSYGIRPFWPFSERWYSWDIVYIYEPVMWAVLILGLTVPGLFSLINQEISSRRIRDITPRGRVAASLALLAVFALWGLRDYEHRRALAALEARNYHGADALRISAYSYPTNPFLWYSVAETPAFFATMDVNSLTPEVDPAGEMQIRYKPEETPITLAAKRSYLGRVYLSWAQYPITETEELSPGLMNNHAAYRVRFRDLRYLYPGQASKAPLGASVFLTQDLKVISAQMGVRGDNDSQGR